MFNVYAIIPLVFFLISSYLFNRHKLIESKDRIYLISIFEAFFCYMLSAIIFLESFMRSTLSLWFIILLMITALIFLIIFQKENDETWDLKIETIKNNMILFFLTLAPFYIFLTIFRFEPILNQILFSILGVVVIYFVELLLKRLLKPIWYKLVSFFETKGLKKYIYVCAFIVFIGLSALMIDLPISKLKHRLNLNDYVGYFSFDGYERLLKNEFKQQQTFTFKFESELDITVLDYFHDEEYFYFYTSTNQIGVVNKSTKELIDLSDLSMFLTNDPYDIFDVNVITNQFFMESGQLYLLAKSGIYKITPTEYTLIHDEITSTNSQIFYVNDHVHFLKIVFEDEYFDYIMVDGEITINQMLTLGSVGDYEITEYLVISERLFFKESGLYVYLYTNPEIYYFIRPGYPIYDEANDYVYFARNQFYFLPIRQDTAYYKVPSLGRTQEVSFENPFNMTGFQVGDYLYYMDMNPNFERIEILDLDLNVVGVSYPILTEPFFITQKISSRYIVNTKNHNETFEYVLAEHGNKNVYLSIFLLEHETEGLPLPFYSHHGLWMFSLVLIAMLVPITQYRQHITIINMDDVTKKLEKRS